jgi:hypothetical protein
MKRLLLVLCCAVVSASAFCFDANSDFKKFMTRTLPKIERAFRNKDLSFFKTIAASDFSETMGGKTTTFEESMKEMKEGFAMSKSMMMKTKLISSKVNGNVGTAVTFGHMVMVTKPAKGDKSHRIVMDMSGTETWVRSGKGWKIKSIVWKAPMKSTMDGKPFDPSKMGGGG